MFALGSQSTSPLLLALLCLAAIVARAAVAVNGFVDAAAPIATAALNVPGVGRGGGAQGLACQDTPLQLSLRRWGHQDGTWEGGESAETRGVGCSMLDVHAIPYLGTGIKVKARGH